MIVNGSLDLSDSSIKSLGNLKEVKGNLDLLNSSIISLGNISEIKGTLNLIGCKNLKDLGNLQKVKKIFGLSSTKISYNLIKTKHKKLLKLI